MSATLKQVVEHVWLPSVAFIATIADVGNDLLREAGLMLIFAAREIIVFTLKKRRKSRAQLEESTE